MTDISEAIALALAAQLDPKARMRKAAQEATRKHIHAGLPTPTAGKKIRCVFSTGEKSFARDMLTFEEGRVYDVVVAGPDCFAYENSLQDNANRLSDEEVEAAAENLRKGVAKFPGSEGTVLVVHDPISGLQSAVTFPFYPTAVFMMVPDDAVDEPQIKTLQPGTRFTFIAQTIVSVNNGVTIGREYVINDVKQGCSCGDPECPAQNVVQYCWIDDDGTECETCLPFCPLGVAAICV